MVAICVRIDFSTLNDLISYFGIAIKILHYFVLNLGHFLMHAEIKASNLKTLNPTKDTKELGRSKNSLQSSAQMDQSNLMDAICFVLGEKTSSLRVRKISDLIYGAPVGKPVSTRCYVAMTYEDDDGRILKFMRLVAGASAEYRIDGATVSHLQYTEALESINIFIRAKNFLVFQGAVENIAMKNPKECTLLFEEISRSGELKAEYETLKAEMMRAEQDTQLNYHRKRDIAAKRRAAKMEKEEAEKYQKLKDSVAEKQSRYYLMKLFSNDRESKRIFGEMNGKHGEQSRIATKCSEVEEVLKERRKVYSKVTREVNKLEQQIYEMVQFLLPIGKNESEITREKPSFIKVKENVRHSERKLEAFHKAFEAARKNAERQQEVIRQFEVQLKEANEQRDAFEAQLMQESESQGLQLDSEQLAQYNSLKGEVVRQCASIQQELDVLAREQQMDQELLDNDKRCNGEFCQKIKQKESELEALKKRLEKLVDTIRNTENEIEEQRSSLRSTEDEVRTAKTRLEQVIVEVEDVNRQLNDANVDSSENSRIVKKQELVENLKRISTGTVYGRVVDLCQPAHKRYQLAVTKILGKYMNAIVVDTEKTAKECIQYMKEQRIESETFLPVDYIDVKPLNEKLRELREPRNVKLIFDVIQFEPPQIRRVVQFACGNSLVCESVEDARNLAFSGAERHRAVALDGTVFEKSGIISGGAGDLKAKAKRWDEKAVAHLRSRKSALIEEQKELHRIRRKEPDISLMQNSVKQLETRMKYMLTDKENTKFETVMMISQETRLLKNLESDLMQLKAETEKYGPRIQEIENRMASRRSNILQNQSRMNQVADHVFADFCKSIGVLNIRQYEEREIRFQQDKKQKMMEFDNQIEKLKNELEYQKSDDKSSTVISAGIAELAQLEKIEASCNKEERELIKAKKEEQEHIRLLADLESQLKDLKAMRQTKKVELENKEAELNEVKKELATIQKELLSVQKQTSAMETLLEQKRSERHSLLQTCKLENITLPIIRGSLDILSTTVSSQSSDTTSSVVSEDGATTLSSTSFMGNRQLYQLEAEIIFDFSSLNPDDWELSDDTELRLAAEKLLKEIGETQAFLQTITAPNLKASAKLEGVRERFAETSGEFEQARKKAKNAKMAFEIIQKERCSRFNRCFDQVSGKIDEIYKALSRNFSSQAYLTADNPEEPYLDGVSFSVVAPGKRFRPMDSLSGGEKTLAALTLLFAIHSYNRAPFFVLDEIDAALDNTNIGKVAAFIREQAANNMQLIVISLKEEFYNQADALIGIYSVVCVYMTGSSIASSGLLTLDLTDYSETILNEEMIFWHILFLEFNDLKNSLLFLSLRNAPVSYSKDWHNYTQMMLDRARRGVGEHGNPVELPSSVAEKAEFDRLYKANGYSGWTSDKISLYRAIKDLRHADCKRKSYLLLLPSTSVIVPFHNEHLSVLLRTVYTIVYRTPPELLLEVILVNDASTKPELNDILERHVQRKFPNLVHVIRAGSDGRREGAAKASGQVLMFMDAHSEVGYNWLPPLLEPIKLHYRTVTCPFIDVIDCDTFAFRAQDEGARGSFDWKFHYKRLPLLNKTGAEPFESPVMAGGYFAISKRWFDELGRYDDQLMIWGAEQYELSFKLWQCHGRMIDIPCSRIAHIYRCKYAPFEDPGIGNFLERNYKRVAETWMDEYKEYLYLRMPRLRNVDPGDLTKQREVRQRLKCNGFDWFMKNVMFDQPKHYPLVEPPDVMSGRIKNKHTGRCMDVKNAGLQTELTTSQCKDYLKRQEFVLSWRSEIFQRLGENCLDSMNHGPGETVHLFACHGGGGNQNWTYSRNTTMHLQVTASNLCLDTDNTGRLFLNTCQLFCFCGGSGKTRCMQWRGFIHLFNLLTASFCSADYFKVNNNKNIVQSWMNSTVDNKMDLSQYAANDDYYNILGCDASSTMEQIVAEFRVRAKKLHPDKNSKSTSANEDFARLSRAKEILTDPHLRKSYDLWRNAGLNIPFDDWLRKANALRSSVHWFHESPTLSIESSSQYANKFSSGDIFYLVLQMQEIGVIIESIRMSEDVKILMWTPFFTETISQTYLSTCPELKCSIVNDRKDFHNSRAVVFHDRNIILKDLPTARKYNQHFVFFLMESPYHTSVAAYPHLSTNFYTKTMTYRRDSDIQIPFGYVQKRKSPRPFDSDSWYQLAKGKTKMVAWWVSNCRTPSKREEYVAKLGQYIQVDIYGNCGNLTCPRSMTKECAEDLRRDYRFYFSFENSICLDYVTEKFFDRLNDAVVPIVPSRKIYENLAPPNSFIAADDFPNPQALADYLHFLSKNLDDYLKYFDWKKEYESIGFPYGFAMKEDASSAECQHDHYDTSGNLYCYKCDYEHEGDMCITMNGTIPTEICSKSWKCK
ncbi:Structural maintenance of chromosomes protein 1A, partial [Trichinella sp. T8]